MGRNPAVACNVIAADGTLVYNGAIDSIRLANQADIARQIAAGDRRVVGAMIESHLVGGRQDVVPGQPLVYGQSITDACLAWDETVPVLETLARAVRKRREG